MFAKINFYDIINLMPTTTIITEKMVFGGDCIGKINGKTVFVPYSLPGEELEIEITRETRDYCNARIVKIITPSPHRTEPFCPHYGICGGCTLQHADPEYQTELRKSVLKDAFLREGLDVPEIKVIAGNPREYRSRFQFHDGGLMRRMSNEIIPIDFCPCASKEINAYLSETPFEKRPAGRIHVFGSEKLISHKGIAVAREMRESGSQMEKISGKKHAKKIRPRFEGTVPVAENQCTVEISGKKITFDAQGFFQSNMEVLEKSVALITGGLEGNHVLDMYSGCGTFSVFLADRFNHVTMVEHNKGAVVFAEQNLAGKSHESYGLSGETWVKYHAEKCIASHGKFDAVVIDPPRSGMEKSVCQWLTKSGIPKIRSVSCDPATLARDIRFLLRGGYKISDLYLLDFYPQTCHIESLACLEKTELP